MTTINLYQVPQEQREKKNRQTINGGFFFSVGMLVFVSLFFGALKIYKNYITGKSADVSAQIEQNNSSFSSKDESDNVIDVQTRLQMINDNIGSQVSTRTILGYLENDIVSSVSVYSYSYNSGKLQMVIDANNFYDVARQLLNFKQASYLSNVNLTSMKRGGKAITFTVEADMKVDKK